MARFSNVKPAAPANKPWSLGPQPLKTRTLQGGVGYVSQEPEIELFDAAVSGLLADQFYETGDARVQRIVDLTHQCNDAWLRGFIPWLRQTANLRSAPLVIAVEYTRAHKPNGRSVIASVLQRADEPGEMLGYWFSRYGRKLGDSVKRGIADALPRLYTERSTLRYDGNAKGFRFGDVIEIVHPKAENDTQHKLFTFLLDRRRHDPVANPGVLKRISLTLMVEQSKARTPEMLKLFLNDPLVEFSWERAGGWVEGGMTASTWETLIPRMGYMALMRNLNNFDRAGISYDAREAVCHKLADPAEVAGSRALPFRFQTAYKNLESDNYKVALAQGAELALTNLPAFPGRTLIMVDCSGSMSHAVGAGKSRNPLRMSEAAGFQAEALARRCADAVIVPYENSVRTAFAPVRHQSILLAAVHAHYTPNGGTNTWSCTKQVLNSMSERPDRIVIITDEQAQDRDDGSITIPVVTWNIGGYRPHHAEHGARNRLFVAGYNDTVLQVLPSIVMRAGTGRWPWESE